MNSLVTVEGIQNADLPAARTGSPAGRGFGSTLRGDGGKAQRSGQAQPGSVPERLHVSTDEAECEHLKSQIAISSSGWRGRRHPPFAFTERDVAIGPAGLAWAPDRIQDEIPRHRQTEKASPMNRSFQVVRQSRCADRAVDGNERVRIGRIDTMSNVTYSNRRGARAR